MHRIAKHLTWKNTALAFIPAVISGVVVNGPVWGTGRLKVLAPGVTIPDLTQHYSPKELPQFFEAMGEQGRAAYLTINNLDFLFIICYSVFGLVAFGTMLRYLTKSKPWASYAALLGLLPGIFDAIESTCFRIIFMNLHEEHETLAEIASVMTNAKFIAINLALLDLVVLLTACMIVRLTRQRNRS